MRMILRASIVTVLIGGLAGAFAEPLANAASAQEMSANQKTILDEQIRPAFHAGNGPVFLDAILRLTGRLPEPQRVAIDRYLQDQQEPTLGEMLLSARAAQLRKGSKFNVPKARPAEVLLILPALERQVDELIASTQQASVLEEGIAPASLQEYEPKFWSLDLIRQEILDVGRSGQEVVRMVSSTRISRATLTEQQRAVLEVDPKDLVAKLLTLYQKVKERDLALRLARLQQAVDVLADSTDVKERFVAAHVVDTDGASLRAAFESFTEDKPARFADQDLNDPDLPGRIEMLESRGRELAGDLIEKSQKLYAGIHWWLRGRYGQGAQFYGLVKGDDAKYSQAAQQLLYMPAKLPTNDKGSNYDYPDRRHHYDWIWETRTLQVRSTSTTTPLPRATGSSQPAPKPKKSYSSPPRLTSISRGGTLRRGGGGGGGFAGSGGSSRSIFLSPSAVAYDRLGWTVEGLYKRLGYDPPKYKRPSGKSYSTTPRSPTRTRTTYSESYIPEQDPYIIYQIVGFLEYTMALQYLDSLANSCSLEELKAVDALIAERDELAVETNLSRAVEEPGSLVEQPQRAGDTFVRRGLPWVTALARAELAAMLVGFASHDPAVVRLASRHDMEEYREMLLDAVRTHYWSLKNDQGLQAVLQGNANANRTLAYFRRLMVADGLLRGAAVLFKDDLLPAQQAELAAWKASLDKLQAVMTKRIADFHQTRVDVNVE